MVYNILYMVYNILYMVYNILYMVYNILYIIYIIYHLSKNSVQKTKCCNLTPNAFDDGLMRPKHVELRIHQ